MQATEVFYQVLTKKMELTEFEAWIYATPEQETTLSADDYLAAISLDYNSRSALYEVPKLLSRYVNWGELRRRELVEILQIIERGAPVDKMLIAFSETYNWYCRGCSFLQDIAFHFLSVDDEFDGCPEGEWAKRSEGQKLRYLARFYPTAQLLAQQLIQQLESGQIQLYVHGPDDLIDYIETHTPTENKLEVRPLGEVPQTKAWWQFWQ